MAKQLDILAFEPFHGGPRRAMLDVISRCSRHRWTLLKLPARRLERRLLVAATWFAEHLSRNEVGNVDLLFCSEAMNLADLLRLRPELSTRPSVVYFHDNQLPDPAAGRPETPTDLVNLNSAMAATEVWFNSLYNLRTFLSRASAMVARHKELQSRNPMPSLAAKAHLMRPPMDLVITHEAPPAPPAAVPPTRSLLVDGRGADHAVLCDVLERLDRRDEPVRLTVIGRVKGLALSRRQVTLNERDDPAHVKAMLAADVLLTARRNAASDDLVVRALAAGHQPIVPGAGVYPELLPPPLHRDCLHDGTAASMLERILQAWDLGPPKAAGPVIDDALSPYDAIRACKLIDERLHRLTTPPANPPTGPSTRRTPHRVGQLVRT